MPRRLNKISKFCVIALLLTSTSSCTWLLNTLLFPKGGVFMSISRQADLSVNFSHDCIKQTLLSMPKVRKIDYKTNKYTTSEAQIIQHHNYTYRTKNDEHSKQISLTLRDGNTVSARHLTSTRGNFLGKEDLAELNSERAVMYLVEEQIEKSCGLPPASFYEWRDCKKIHHPDQKSSSYGSAHIPVLCKNYKN